VKSSEKILKCRFWLKVALDYWLDDEDYGEEERLEENTEKFL